MIPPRRGAYDCPACGARLPRGDLGCDACGTALVDPARVERARVLTESLITAHGDDPYLRSAGLLTYSLRSRVRGFLEDPGHPFVAALLAYLQELLALGGESAWTQLRVHAEREWIDARAPVLARALRTLCERWGEAGVREGTPPR